jgi:hypothetical protein
MGSVRSVAPGGGGRSRAPREDDYYPSREDEDSPRREWFQGLPIPRFVPVKPTAVNFLARCAMTTNPSPFYGLPPAATVVQSITLAQLLILRRIDAQRRDRE